MMNEIEMKQIVEKYGSDPQVCARHLAEYCDSIFEDRLKEVFDYLYPVIEGKQLDYEAYITKLRDKYLPPCQSEKDTEVEKDVPILQRGRDARML